MKLHNKYGYGQLFCFSGIDGETSRAELSVMLLRVSEWIKSAQLSGAEAAAENP